MPPAPLEAAASDAHDAPRPATDAASSAAAVLASTYPALRHLLGPEHFAALVAGAEARAAAQGHEPGAVVHGLLVRRDAPLPEGVPARLAADVAALEWTIRRISRLASPWPEAPRATPADLAALLSESPQAGAPRWRSARFEPIRAFAIVPVAWRLDAWVRRLHTGRPVRRPPSRQELHIVVCVTEVLEQTWWFAQAPAHGRLLEHLALGVPAGLAVDAALASGDIEGPAASLALMDTWLREGLFARVVVANAGAALGGATLDGPARIAPV